mmetsp:Transcript_7073/g.22133  ORF Transcript_7073/g.22133 Transcript_7073/m.22133 type:complete len:226 (+) Transcript_7073:1082-1759(+)
MRARAAARTRIGFRSGRVTVVCATNTAHFTVACMLTSAAVETGAIRTCNRNGSAYMRAVTGKVAPLLLRPARTAEATSARTLRTTVVRRAARPAGAVLRATRSSRIRRGPRATGLASARTARSRCINAARRPRRLLAAAPSCTSIKRRASTMRARTAARTITTSRRSTAPARMRQLRRFVPVNAGSGAPMRPRRARGLGRTAPRGTTRTGKAANPTIMTATSHTP